MQRELTQVNEIISQQGKVITKRPVQEPTQSQRNILRKNLVPLMPTMTTPNEIMNKHMDLNDISAMTKYLIDYQRSHADWQEYRNKIPNVLLEKWLLVVTECAEKGFINPHVRREKIIF